LAWIETQQLAIHLVEEHVRVAGQADKQTVYASNIYRQGSTGWRILMHQNSPTPPPPGLQMPPQGRAQVTVFADDPDTGAEASVFTTQVSFV
jgi:hypothetical protein